MEKVLYSGTTSTPLPGFHSFLQGGNSAAQVREDESEPRKPFQYPRYEANDSPDEVELSPQNAVKVISEQGAESFGTGRGMNKDRDTHSFHDLEEGRVFLSMSRKIPSTWEAIATPFGLPRVLSMPGSL